MRNAQSPSIPIIGNDLCAAAGKRSPMPIDLGRPAQLVVAASLLVCGAVTSSVGAEADRAADVRVGVVAVEDFDVEQRIWLRTLAGLSQKSEQRLRFRLAVGTYGDLLHWMDKRLIDVAILTPGVYAEARSRSELGRGCEGFEYLATIGLPAATSKWATADRRQARFHYGYHAVCVVSAESPLRSLDDLRRASEQGRVETVFVHPLSMSGRIVPENALRTIGLHPERVPAVYSYSHTGSLRLLLEPSEGRQRVAFVWDDALAAAPELSDKVRRLGFPTLDRIEIPHDVVVADTRCEYFGDLERLLIDYVDDRSEIAFQRIDHWSRRYATLAGWSRAVRRSHGSDQTQLVSLDEIGHILLHSVRSQRIPPRLAVVMSGGGAKCSYQVGVLSALEQKLANLRRANPDCDLDIGLVVGTSGGAINAVPVALGISSSDAGRLDFQDVWKKMDQRNIIRPGFVVRTNIGLWFALLQTAFAIVIARCFIRKPHRRAWFCCLVLLTLASVEILLGYLPGAPWRMLGRNHIWHHAWLWCSFGIRASAWSLLLLGAGGLILHEMRRRRGEHLALPARRVVWTLVVLLVALPLIQIVTVLFFQRTLSGGEGVEHALGRNFSALIDRHLKRQGKPGLNLGSARTDAERMEAMSRDIVKRGLFKRDLVITGNCLEQSAGTLPSDLYFYAHAADRPSSPPFGSRGISLHRHPSIILDVVMGSSAIFPLFPPRTLGDFPVAGERVELIDGGFAHNSPIEAAVLWGATHIILLEATPTRRGPRRNFAENASAAFVHLHRQTQLVDVRSKRQVVVFTLTPEPPHICVLDFADNLVEESIQRGFRDALGLEGTGTGAASVRPRFRKELGEPTFTEISDFPKPYPGGR